MGWWERIGTGGQECVEVWCLVVGENRNWRAGVCGGVVFGGGRE